MIERVVGLGDGDIWEAVCVRRAMTCIGQEFPNQPQWNLLSWDNIRRPREETPVFFGCYDWHSAVHAHWLLVRMLRLRSDAVWAAGAEAILSQNLTAELLARECQHLSKAGREGFERPYGLAWLLQLCAELRQWKGVPSETVCEAIAPLEDLVRQRFIDWLYSLRMPIRTGEHNQTAFSLGLLWDWSCVTRDHVVRDMIRETAFKLYGDDAGLPIQFEPSAHDFLSPALAEVDLVRRVMDDDVFPKWIRKAFTVAAVESMCPVTVVDINDGKLAHWDGLNLSRSWMAEAIAERLDARHELRDPLIACSVRHTYAGERALESTSYAGTHWLGTFYVYRRTRKQFSTRFDADGVQLA